MLRLIRRIVDWYYVRKVKMYYVCECCGRLRTDVQWREDTEQYECEKCYQWWLEHYR